MLDIIKKYHSDFKQLLDYIKGTDKEGNELGFSKAIYEVCNLLKIRTVLDGKVIFIGNGGSAAISSHMAVDFWKNGNIRAIAFNDSSLLTCISNDFGYKYVFEKPIEMFADKEDVLFAISSSGMSENIIRGVEAARLKECKVITLSGFSEDNKLRTIGDINFYVPSLEYGPVEVAHQFICHWILDTIIAKSVL